MVCNWGWGLSIKWWSRIHRQGKDSIKTEKEDCNWARQSSGYTHHFGWRRRLSITLPILCGTGSYPVAEEGWPWTCNPLALTSPYGGCRLFLKQWLWPHGFWYIRMIAGDCCQNSKSYACVSGEEIGTSEGYCSKEDGSFQIWGWLTRLLWGRNSGKPFLSWVAIEWQLASVVLLCGDCAVVS